MQIYRFFTTVVIIFAAIILLARGELSLAAEENAHSTAIAAFENLDNSSADSDILRALDFLETINTPAEDNTPEISLADLRLFGPNRFSGEEFDLEACPENIENVIEAFQVVKIGSVGIDGNFDDRMSIDSLFDAYVSLAVMTGFDTPRGEKHDSPILLISSRTHALQRTRSEIERPVFNLAFDFDIPEDKTEFLTPRTPVTVGYVLVIRTNSRIE